MNAMRKTIILATAILDGSRPRFGFCRTVTYVPKSGETVQVSGYVIKTAIPAAASEDGEFHEFLSLLLDKPIL